MSTDHHDLEACGSLIRTRRTAADPAGHLVAEVHYNVVPEANRLAAAMAAAPRMLSLLT